MNKTAFGVALLALTGAGSVLSVRAQTDRVPPTTMPVIVPPDFWPHPRPNPVLGQELQLIEQKAKVKVDGAVAKTSLSQTFQNPTDRTIEGTYLFPLPSGAAVSGFAMTINGKRTEAEILEGDKAREIYNGIVQKLRDPAILEFADRDVLRARIFPIAPRSNVDIDLEYNQALRAEGSSFRYSLPMRLPLGGAARQASVDIDLRASDLKSVYSPSHPVDVHRNADGAHITGEWKEEGNQTSNGPRDFSLLFTTGKGRIGLSLLTYTQGNEDPYFMLLAAPDTQIAQREIAAKDVVFVFDTSGSMSGEKIEQAKRALDTLLGDLNPNDRFNIVTFASDVNPFREGMTTAGKANLDEARGFAKEIKAVGGTNINDALQAALKMLNSSRTAGAARPRQIVFMTDGQPTVGETSVDQIVKNTAKANGDDSGARLFVFGVGYDVNTRLLDTLAEDNRGASDYVAPSEDIEAKVGSLYAKIAYPVLTGATLQWNGARAYDVYPPRLPDLFRGSQTVVFGRLKLDGTPHVQLSGMAGNAPEKVEAEAGKAPGSVDVVPRLWATRKVGYLLDDARRNNRAVADEVRDEIIALSKKFGIVTPLTAGLITEDGTPLPGPQPIPMLRNGTMAQDAPMLGSLFKSSRGAFSNPLPSTGAGAVAGSQAARNLRENERVADTKDVRYMEGKAFFLRNGIWTDTTYDAAKSPQPVVVKFASPEYFALVKDARVAKWLSLGENVLFVWNEKVYKVEP